MHYKGWFKSGARPLNPVCTQHPSEVFKLQFKTSTFEFFYRDICQDPDLSSQRPGKGERHSARAGLRAVPGP